MPDSATVRLINLDRIREIMRNGEEYTKQQIASLTGLSVATSNTLLNELEKSGEIVGEKKRLNEVGRNTVVYRMREEYESFLCILIENMSQKSLQSLTNAQEEASMKLSIRRTSPTRKELEQKEVVLPQSRDALLECIKNCIGEAENIKAVMIGLHGNVSQGILYESEIKRLSGFNLAKEIEKETGVFCMADSILSLAVYQIYQNETSKEEGKVISLVDFSEKKLPILATVHKGTVIEGSRGFAGSIAYLPFGISTQAMPLFFKKSTFMPFAIKFTTSVIAMMNPSKLVIAGNLMEEKKLGILRQLSCESIPDDYVPEFSLLKDYHDICFEGMISRVLEMRRRQNAM